MTDKYAVIGHPIAHSKSPQIHAMFAQQTGQDISYGKIEVSLEEDGFKTKAFLLRDEGYRGCNVTVPFKLDAFQLTTELTERAEAAQAVNTLKFEGNAILGDNTDGIGLVRDITQNLGFSLLGKHALLIGSGGAAYGVARPLMEAGAHLTIANRTEDKADLLARILREWLRGSKSKASIKNSSLIASPESCSYENLQGKQYDIIINATSAGLKDEMPDIPKTLFAPGSLAYDMMYGRETPFMKFAREHGAAVVSDGLGMLVEQAAESFYIWRGVRPDTAPVIAALRQQ